MFISGKKKREREREREYMEGTLASKPRALGRLDLLIAIIPPYLWFYFS